MKEPESGQRFDLCASLEEMIENPEGEFVLSSDLDEALALLRVGGKLWHEWRTVDITDDDERWADYTNRAHAHHDAIVAYLQKMGAKPEAPSTHPERFSCDLCGGCHASHEPHERRRGLQP